MCPGFKTFSFRISNLYNPMYVRFEINTVTAYPNIHHILKYTSTLSLKQKSL